MQDISSGHTLPFNPEFHRDLGGLFISGFDGGNVRSDIFNAVKSGLGGVILFPRNLEKPGKILELTENLRKASPTGDLIITMDQEGGRVARLKAPFTEFPPMASIGAKNDGELARMVGQAIARELLAVGINLDFAPVMDLDKHREGAVIGDRSFGTDPDIVSRAGRAFIEGMQGEGVATCAKHFPGHGATELDSHVELPEVNLDREQLKRHLEPFKTVVDSGAASIMTAHIRCNALDPHHPATISERILKGILRDEMGYEGMVITDDLGMKGITDLLPAEDAAAMALRAGADMLLIAHDLKLAGKLRQTAHEMVRHMLLDPDDIMEKIERTAEFRKKYKPPRSLPGLGVIGCREHRELAREAAG